MKEKLESWIEACGRSRIQTPAYVFDLDQLKGQVQKLRDELGEKIRLVYAMKANPFLAEVLAEEVDGLEVCSPGEFRICERAQIPMEKIVLSGVNKEEKEICRVVNAYGGRGIYTVESVQQMELLQKAAGQADQKLRVLLRLTSGNQFGMDCETIRRIVKERERWPHLCVEGLQLYTGTQKKRMNKMEKELQELDAFCAELKTDDFCVRELEYGPGFPVSYFEEGEVDLHAFRNIVDGLSFSGTLTLEIGRYLAAGCGSYITSVVDQKKNGSESYLIVDGGINHFNYYGQTMAMKIPPYHHYSRDGYSISPADTEAEPWNVCGSLCTVGDVLVRQLPLKNPRLGDILVFDKIGAYAVTEGIYLFLSRDLPQIWFWSGEEGIRLVRDVVPTDGLNSR